MRLIRNSAIALLALAGAVVLAASGIEVLSIDLQPDGSALVTTMTDEVPMGSTLEAVMVLGPLELVVDMCPAISHGIEVLSFPIHQPGNRINLRGPGGELLAIKYVDGIELD